jgi:hypothetical protein
MKLVAAQYAASSASMSFAPGLDAADSRINGMGERRYDSRFETCDITGKDVVDVGSARRVTHVHIKSQRFVR